MTNEHELRALESMAQPATITAADINKLIQTVEIGLRPDASRSQYAVNTLGQHLKEAQVENATLRASLTTARQREARLREALKPFADAYDGYLEHCKNAKYDGDIRDYLEDFYASGDVENMGVMAVAVLAEQAAAADGNGDDAEFTALCQREIVKIRELTLKDDEYTGGLLGDAVGSPVGITACVEARMKQIADLQAEVRKLESKNKNLKRKSNLDEGFIDFLTEKDSD